MIPKNFLKMKKTLDKKFECFEGIENLELKKEINNLQKEIIKCMYLYVSKIEEKEKLIDLIYQYRYYNFLPIENNKNIYQVKELKNHLSKLTKSLINKAEEMKIITRIIKDEDKNYKVVEKLFLSKIIELENIEIKITKENEKLYITVYDEDVEDDKSELKNIKKEELKIKLGKKTKLFI